MGVVVWDEDRDLGVRASEPPQIPRAGDACILVACILAACILFRYLAPEMVAALEARKRGEEDCTYDERVDIWCAESV